MDALPREVLDFFGVAEPVFLGGRMRKHWAVERGAERLVITRHAEPEASILFETQVLRAVSELGWPVPVVLEGAIEAQGAWWTLCPLMPGQPKDGHDDPRWRGRLLAEFHLQLQTITPLGPRPGRRRAETYLYDEQIEQTLRNAEQTKPEEVEIVRDHLERARKLLKDIDLEKKPSQLIHGDFTNWNLLNLDGRLSAILDFELAREDHRIAEFALAWRGKYDDVIHAYNEVAPFEPWEWQALTPLWWLELIGIWCYAQRDGGTDGEWALSKLQQRSPLIERYS